MKLLLDQRSHLWSLGDQALVAGCNLLVGILLARLLGLEAFGVFAIAQMYLMYANTFQQSLVSAPMMTAVPSESNEAHRAFLIRGFFGYSLLVLSAMTLLVQIISFGLGSVSEGLRLPNITLPFIAALLCYQLQDGLRRVLYVKSNNRDVFISDVLAYGGQLLGIITLGLQGLLNVSAALWVIAAAFGTSALFIVLTQHLLPSVAATKHVIKTHGHNGRDMLMSSQLQWMGSSGVILIGAGFVGSQAAGAIRVAQTLLGPVNVIFQWMDNVIPVRAATLLREQGMKRLIAFLRRIGFAGVVIIGLFALVLGWLDEWLIVLVYGEAYRAFAILLVLQAIYYLFGHAYRMLSYFSRATGNTMVLAKASVWWSVVSITMAWWVVQLYADRGIMFALIAGEIAALVYLIYGFVVMHRAHNKF